MSDLQILLDLDFKDDDRVLSVFSKKFYDEIKEFVRRHEVRVETKYRSVAKKVKLVALLLSLDCEEKIGRASRQPNLRDTRKIGHEFINRMTLDGLKVRSEEFFTKIKNECFRKMLLYHEKTFAFELHEIRCVDSNVVAPIVIFTISHMPWNLQPIPVRKAQFPKLVGCSMKISRWEF